jgi:GNAT superfamily N-acetyltransferase
VSFSFETPWAWAYPRKRHNQGVPTKLTPAPRRATAEDRAAVIETVAAAFVDDPAWSYITGGRADLTRLFASTLFDSRVEAGQVWLHEGALSVALWDTPRPPDANSPAPQGLWDEYRTTASPAEWARLKAYDDAVEAARPKEPFWYLGVLATHPDARGRGLASTVLDPVFAQADAAGLACCLETSKTGNLHFYRNRGFTESSPVALADGPATWWLTRPAKPEQASPRG